MILFQPHHARINLVFDSWVSLGIILLLMIGFILWMTFMFITQRNLIKRVNNSITQAELTEAFAAFRREIKAGQ